MRGSSAMLPLVTAQTVASERGGGGRISRRRTRGGQSSSRCRIWEGAIASNAWGAHQMNKFDQDRRMISYARFPIGTTFPILRGTRDTTAALARSSKAVAMYFACCRSIILTGVLCNLATSWMGKPFWRPRTMLECPKAEGITSGMPARSRIAFQGRASSPLFHGPRSDLFHAMPLARKAGGISHPVRGRRSRYRQGNPLR